MESVQKTYLVELTKSLVALMPESELIDKVNSNKISVQCRLFNEDKNTWVKIMDSQIICTNIREWHFLRDKNSVGPFNRLEMIRMVQQKKISPTQLVWKKGMTEWQEFCRTQEFAPKNIRQLVQDFPPLVQSVFSRRVSSRISFQADFILHNEEKIWKAESYEIGMGGVGIQVQNSNLSIGQMFDLHLISAQAIQSFSAKAEVVSHLKDSKNKKPDRFGLKFIEIEKAAQQKIISYVERVLLQSSSK